MCTLLYVRMYVLFSCLATYIVVNKFNNFLFIVIEIYRCYTCTVRVYIYSISISEI